MAGRELGEMPNFLVCFTVDYSHSTHKGSVVKKTSKKLVSVMRIVERINDVIEHPLP